MTQPALCSPQVDKRPLSVGWVDYRKAYDVVLHQLIHKALKAIKAPREIRTLLQKVSRQWRTVVSVKLEKGSHSELISFERGLFQGDSLSPLLFCLPLTPPQTEGGVPVPVADPGSHMPHVHGRP